MKRLVRYIIILVAVLILWNTVIIKPLKIFTVFLHELGHVLMAFIFGQGIIEFKVNLNESGHTIVYAGNWLSKLMITSGGYLGSILFALLILYLKRTFLRKYILGAIAIIFLTVTIRFSGLSFALAFSVLFAIAVILIYMSQSEKLNDWAVDILGISSVAYAIYDTFVDTILLELNNKLRVIVGWSRSGHMTDAVRMAEITGIPAIVWGIIWFCISIFAVYVLLIEKPKAKSRK
jgi:hypothetical protein